jgi:LmbE family N-acetylglucosaminyl deacetylase
MRGIVRSWRGPIDLPCVIVAAHPDDETLGASLLLQRAAHCNVVHLTDGAPRDPSLRSGATCATRLGYAQARRRELHAALAQAKIPSHRATSLGAVDQEATFALTDLTRRLCAQLAASAPAFVVTHAYEGGHPDHDAAAFVTRMALDMYAAAHGAAPALFEMASYHAAQGQLSAGQFIAESGSPGVALWLTASELECKLRMLGCYTTQTEVIARLARPPGRERFRIAPRYDFTRAPHAGRLHYEQLGWPMRGERFRQIARAAQLELEFRGGACRFAY